MINIFLIHLFCGLEIGAVTVTNSGASTDVREPWRVAIKAGTGDDKTDILVIAIFTVSGCHLQP